MRRSARRLALSLGLALAFALFRSAGAVEVVALPDPSAEMVEIRMMIKAGSAHDPAGKEGLAALSARLLLEGAFGSARNPVTKEEVARRVLPYGGRARPEVFLQKETTTFTMTVPEKFLSSYLRRILGPMFTKPLYPESELQRLRNELLTYITGTLRLQSVELAGLEAFDAYMYEGTSYAHPVEGSVRGIRSITRGDVRRFVATYYRTDNMILGLRARDPEKAARKIEKALRRLDSPDASAEPFPLAAVPAPTPFEGRELLVVGVPGSGIATGIHMGFPLPLGRTDEEFWPLLVANVWFGIHRDDFSHLYQVIRQARGYNYGDYSYIEHFASRPYEQTPPFNTPRSSQYFSIWIRPVAGKFAHHILKAALWEFETLIREGLTAREVEFAKEKARGQYVKLAETQSRRLQAAIDDAFYGGRMNFLEEYKDRISAVTAGQVNAAIRKYFRAADLKMLIVTAADGARELAEDIAANRNASGKSAREYNWVREGEEEEFDPTPEQSRILAQDRLWKEHPLRLSPERVRVVQVNSLFESGAFLTPPPASR